MKSPLASLQKKQICKYGDFIAHINNNKLFHMKITKISKALLTLVFLFSFSGVFAQLPEDPDPDVDGPGDDLNPAPIGDYMAPMLILGIATAYVLLRKKNVQNV